jgi:uncharacterized repeat protein (TIGR03803 family)
VDSWVSAVRHDGDSLPAQTFATLHSFGGADGGNPGGLVQATDGNFYGTTELGGANFCILNGLFTNGCGTIFKITPTGTLTTLYSFCAESGCMDGSMPYGTLVQGADGDFYGTTLEGGANGISEDGYGTVFKIAPSGRLTTLHSFNGADGWNPWAGLVQATNGDLYGTTSAGGAHDGGAVFKVTPNGALTTIHSFCAQGKCTAGYNPIAPLLQGSDGDLYGTTSFGGVNDDGAIFKITLNGTLTTLYAFCAQSGCTDGAVPYAGLAQATDGNLYGTTSVGGAYGNGTVFKITLGGTLTTLYNFCALSGCTDGASPHAGLVQATNGDFYGTTANGGANSCITDGADYGCGSVFSLSLSLGGFVEIDPTSGKVGTVVKILGNNLADATSVTFNGTPAVIEVFSKTVLTVTVPTGATTGPVQVVTPSATLTSNVPFRVLP